MNVTWKWVVSVFITGFMLISGFGLNNLASSLDRKVDRETYNSDKAATDREIARLTNEIRDLRGEIAAQREATEAKLDRVINILVEHKRRSQ